MGLRSLTKVLAVALFKQRFFNKNSQTLRTEAVGLRVPSTLPCNKILRRAVMDLRGGLQQLQPQDVALLTFDFLEWAQTGLCVSNPVPKGSLH